MEEKAARVYVGTAGWKKPQWRGDFYPRGLVQRRELEFASRQLTSLEINTTFHGLQRPSTFANWRTETPDEFVFEVKGHRAVTHTAHLRNTRVNLADFFASGVLGLEHKLGPILWQLPPELPFRAGEIEQFLQALPGTVDEACALAHHSELGEWTNPDLPNRPIRHAVEVRNATFLNPTFVDLLRQHGVAAVVTNSANSPAIRERTGDVIYIRLDSDDSHYANGYDDDTLSSWAELIIAWMNDPAQPDVFVYFKNPTGMLIHTPRNATRLIELLSAR